MSNTAPCQRRGDKYHSTPDGRQERRASHDHRCQSTHDSTRSSFRQCSGFQDTRPHHWPGCLGMCRVCESRWCSWSGGQFTKELTPDYEEVSNFFSLSSVILPCSAAATGSSAPASC